LSELAAATPDAVALVCVDESGVERDFTIGALARSSAQLARALQERGIDAGSLVVLALPNGPEMVTLSYAAWWLGACVLPYSPKAPAQERAAVLDAAKESGRAVVVVDEHGGLDAIHAGTIETASRALSAEPLADVVPHPGRAIASGGSTGLPKVIAETKPHVAVPDTATRVSRMLGREPGQTALVFGPMYHTLSYGTVFSTLFDRGCVVLMARFDEQLALEIIERHRVQVLATVPAHLHRLAGAPGIETRDLSSIVSLYHSGAACPAWLKRRWIDLIGPTRLYEGFGSTEAVGMLVIRGDEWLEHPGSVGRCELTDVVIRDACGVERADGDVGEIYMRWRPGAGYQPPGATDSYRYWGSAPARATEDGFVSVGDLGWLDDGYLYVADRRVDMIITGGVNVYPAEVEAALSEHPDVADVAVVGVSDERWGKRVHAIVQPCSLGSARDALATALDAFARERLSSVKVPKSYEIVTQLPRNDVGKVRRRELAEQRSADVQPNGAPR
jgi:bile acid-coenzyme A ligase